jgi:MFS family permease
MAPPVALIEESIILNLVAQDHVKWWNKPNLRTLYLLLVPFCLFIESTSGFDSSMMNGMQALTYWKKFFDYPKGGQLGLLVACYNLGAITSIPFISLVSDRFGRRKSIVFGSTIMCIGKSMPLPFGRSETSELFDRDVGTDTYPGAIMQGLSRNC